MNISRAGIVAQAIAASAILAGCALQPPTAAEQAAADYGAPPTNYAQAIQVYFQQTLKDPSSIQYGEVTQPVQGFYSIKDALISGGQVHRHYGWLVRATINAKNSYGGYVGFKTYTFVFHGENLIHVDSPE